MPYQLFKVQILASNHDKIQTILYNHYHDQISPEHQYVHVIVKYFKTV